MFCRPIQYTSSTCLRVSRPRHLYGDVLFDLLILNKYYIFILFIFLIFGERVSY